MNVVDATSTNKQKTNIALLQKDLTRTNNIYKKLNKLQVLYKSNKRRNNELIF